MSWSLLGSQSDRRLVELSQRGDRDAYGLLVDRYQRLVMSVAYHTGADPDSAQDVAQDVFLRAWQALPGFDMQSDTAFRSWICRIASNRTVDLLRRQQPVDDVDELNLTGGLEPADVHGRQELVETVRRAIRRMPESSRQVLVLREYAGLSYREISQALDVPIGTVMSRLHYARNWLRRDLAPYMEQP